MQERLVLWGTIGNNIKSLLAIYLDDANNEVLIHAFPKEQVTEQVQNDLFAWKNGAKYSFPQNDLIWHIDVNGDSLLPREISVEKPEFIQRAQENWSKFLMSRRIFQVCKEEIVLHKTFVQAGKKYEQANWDKTIQLWNKYTELLKSHELTFDHSRLLKAEVDDIFEILKTQKFQERQESQEKEKKALREFDKKLEALKALLIYPDEWNSIHEQLKGLNEELKILPVKHEARRKLFEKIDVIYKSLRSYKKTQNKAHLEKRLADLNRIVKSIDKSISRDQKNLEEQQQKIAFYTKGKGLNNGMNGLLQITQKKIDENVEKAKDIRKTIAKLEKELVAIQHQSNKPKTVAESNRETNAVQEEKIIVKAKIRK